MGKGGHTVLNAPGRSTGLRHSQDPAILAVGRSDSWRPRRRPMLHPQHYALMFLFLFAIISMGIGLVCILHDGDTKGTTSTYLIIGITLMAFGTFLLFCAFAYFAYIKTKKRGRISSVALSAEDQETRDFFERLRMQQRRRASSSVCAGNNQSHHDSNHLQQHQPVQSPPYRYETPPPSYSVAVQSQSLTPMQHLVDNPPSTNSVDTIPNGTAPYDELHPPYPGPGHSE